MRDRLNRFIDNTNGHFIEVSYAPALYQCLDLAYLWIFTLDIPKATIQHGSAYQVYQNASDFTRQYFDIIPNKLETVPEAGDLAVWGTSYGKYGHIAVVIEATQTRMKVFEQNNPIGTNAHVQDRTYNSVIGFLRPRIKSQDVIPPYLMTLSQEVNIDLFNEGEVRAFWDKGKKYDEETASLKKQIVSANEALADRANEVSVLTEQNQKLTDARAEAEETLNKVKGERDTFSWEATQLKIKNEALESEITKLTEEVERHKKNNSLMAYSFWERLRSLWGR